ncbi:MAG: C-GCAxxG-C-C family protein [Bacteroidales bacterium]|nr:C-GCAxxG-C-C family protein [Bacteroidales bacterium]
MYTKEELDERVQSAVEYFMKGYGCGQSVVAAFADLYGLTEAQALMVGAGFGGGVGRLRMMCGAVSGLVVLAGLDSPETAGEDPKAKAACYGLVQKLLATYKAENGSIICAELLGLKPLGSFEDSLPASGAAAPACALADTNIGSPVPDERNAEYYRKRPCAAKVESAARIFASYLLSK